MQQARSDCLSRVHGHHRTPAILMAEEVMAAFSANHDEATLRERCEQFGTGDFGSCRYGDALDADELETMFGGALHFEA